METLSPLKPSMATTTTADDAKATDVYLLVDVSAALTSRKFAKDLDAVVARAKESGVQKLVVRSTSVHSSREALRLCRLFPETLFCCAGVSPHESRLWTPDSEREICDVMRSAECVAFGECGLDFSRDFSPKETQIQVFEKQLQMASHLSRTERIQKPLLVREVDAFAECAALLRQYAADLPQIVVQFRGTEEHARQYLDVGAFLALSGLVFKDKSEDGVRRLLRSKGVPLSRLLLHSDSPYGYPNARAVHLSDATKSQFSARSLSFLNRYCTFQRNEPCSLALTCEWVAAHLGVAPPEVALQTTYNALRVFGLCAH